MGFWGLGFRIFGTISANPNMSGLSQDLTGTTEETQLDEPMSDKKDPISYLYYKVQSQ